MASSAEIREQLDRLLQEQQATSSHIAAPLPQAEHLYETSSNQHCRFDEIQAIMTSQDSYDEKIAGLSVIEEEEAFCQHRLDVERQTVEEMDQRAREEVRAMFDVESSDDSDGFDPDYDAEWRDHTRHIFAVCHEVELRRTDSGCNDLAKILRDPHPPEDFLTLSEVQMLWDAIRFVYRSADPVHTKHWLSHTHEIVNNGNFQNHISLINYLHVMEAALECSFLSDRHKRKIRKWANRTMVLFHKRIIRLEDYGIVEPTWFQVNVSNADRNAYVPINHIWRLAVLNHERRGEPNGPNMDAAHVNIAFKPVDDCGPIYNDTFNEARMRDPAKFIPKPPKLEATDSNQIEAGESN